ncbi:phosphorylase superfamily protein [Mycobacterium xenopi 3993]|nr:phosphorylase superfamily protein [Mycobacterium xenopi 3993]
MWALRALGVRRVFAPCAVGSLTAELGPGTVVVPDQLLDRTHGRADTYFESGGVHASFADPYCPALRAAVTSIPASSTAAPWWWSKARGFPLGRKADGMPRRDARWST